MQHEIDRAKGMDRLRLHGEPDTAVCPRPVSLRELMAQYPYGQRIAGWAPDNPPEVERAFRVGFRIGAERCSQCDLEEAADFDERLHKRRGDLYWGELNVGFDRWSDRRAALLRGATQGALEVVRARAMGVKQGLASWLEQLSAWSGEDPLRLEWRSAMPPDPPEPDAPPLERKNVPRRLWSEVYGLWTLFDAKTALPQEGVEHAPDSTQTPVTVSLTKEPDRLENIPPCLRELPQWVCWRYQLRQGKRTKVPVNPRTMGPASATDPATWTPFEEALAAWHTSEPIQGVGFVFSEDDPFCGVDLDDCIDPASGAIEPWAHEILKALDSYAEISPSGTGAKIFLRATKPGKRCRRKYGTGEIELYDQSRFFTVTGKHLAMASPDVESRQQELDALYDQVFSQEVPTADLPVITDAAPTVTDFDDDFIIEKASALRKSGEKFQALWAGQWQNHFSSCSEADSSLCFMLAFYTKDAEQLDRLFRRSGLMRAKWDELRGEETYGQITLRKALETVTGQYKIQPCVVQTDDGPVESELVPLGQTDPGTNRLVLSPKRTLPTAEAFVKTFYTRADGRTLHSWAGLLMEWRGNRYIEAEDEAFRHRLLPWLHEALRYVANRRTGALQLTAFDANPGTVKAALDSVRAYVHLPASVTPPAWLEESQDHPPPREILPCRSHNLHIPTGWTFPATPALFVTSALDFDHDPDAPRPSPWLDFLAELWDGDTESIELLQEWFGYCLTADTSQQKMLLLVGPRRSGKGTIGRVLARLVGPANVCGPTISSLAGPFGLQPLVGKALAIVSDARFACKDISTVVERLLCISGEDALTIDRKHKESVTLRLPTRLVFLTNELPRLAESSGALAGRFLVLTLTQSFYGREDRQLTETLFRELPGILLWALEGWKRLEARGRFLQPESARDAVREVEDLASPVGAFVRQCCDLGPGCRVWTDDLYEAWRQWCAREGWHNATTRASFGRDLAAAVPGLTRRRGAGDARFYEGIDLKGCP